MLLLSKFSKNKIIKISQKSFFRSVNRQFSKPWDYTSKRSHYPNSQVTLVLGSQWGDEGKGKLVDQIANEYDVICRFNGGNNAGHSVVTTINGKKIKLGLHLFPCGALHEKTVNLLGNGTVIHIPSLFEEVKLIEDIGIDALSRLLISSHAQIVTDLFQLIDGLEENEKSLGVAKKIGTTRKGIGVTYAMEKDRIGLRVGDFYGIHNDVIQKMQFEEQLSSLMRICKGRFSYLLDPKFCSKEDRRKWDEYTNIKRAMDRYTKYSKILSKHNTVINTMDYLNDAIKKFGKKILIEGANGVLLDTEYGTYPYVTSSCTLSAGICTGLGIPPRLLKKVDFNVIGVAKAYQTRVGEGPMATELPKEENTEMALKGGEFGVTTGRQRRCGWLDIVALKYSHQLNEFDQLILTKLDILSGYDTVKLGVGYRLKNGQTLHKTIPIDNSNYDDLEVIYETLPGWKEDISGIRSFEDLPINAQNYVRRIEKLTGIFIRWIGVGPDREETIEKLH
ncbi:adenylosuccinate synthetase [Anaeramoeba flamelloides]|uniref:Adenylosuccinate synthetase n=1 Tax=Anaeramoeba flamelloides TaxID=1746091 RepID=A0AAV8A821_9EUKA|nr:adenylosuccinate synthetase [Anaeramoeba flamelloides]|eukprot:Anaeramoba_flamelloidesa92605_578.p1 GENE.a92605_578~~a92605_578.p1  ORF type:complete len:505 (-),score=110.95 a92605_578:210-1724(-)